MGVTVCTACYYKSEMPIRGLVKSCRKFGVALHAYGCGKQFVSLCDAKIRGLREFLMAHVKSGIVIFLDGNDTFLTTDLDAMLERVVHIIDSGSVPLTIAGERMHWPPVGLDKWFKKAAEVSGSKSPYIYIDSGCIVAATEYLIDVLGKLEKRVPDFVARAQRYKMPKSQWYNDLGPWSMCLADGTVRATIDRDCRVSIALKRCGPAAYDLEPGRLSFKLTGDMPPVVHMNGNREKRGLSRYYEMVLGEPLC